MLHRVHPARVGFKLTTLVVKGTDCIGRYKYNYHTILTNCRGKARVKKLNTDMSMWCLI